jgi:MFS family permease
MNGPATRMNMQRRRRQGTSHGLGLGDRQVLRGQLAEHHLRDGGNMNAIVSESPNGRSPGRRRRRASGSIADAMVGSAMNPTTSEVTVMPSCAPDSMKLRRLCTAMARFERRSPSLGLLDEPERRDATNENSTATKYPFAAIRATTPNSPRAVSTASTSFSVGRHGGHARSPPTRSTVGASEQASGPGVPTIVTMQTGDEGLGGLPGGRLLFGVSFVHSAVEYAAWITMLVVAFENGGATAAGLVVAIQLIPAAVLAPLVTAAGDRFPRHLVLSVGFAVLAVCAAAISATLAADAGLVLVYAGAAVFTVVLVSFPGAVASLLVHHARTPTQLMHWNIWQSFARAGGVLTGPLVTALLLAITEPAVVFGATGAACALTAATIHVRLPRDDRETSTVRLRAIVVDAIEGVRYVATERTPRRVIGFISATGLLVGGLDVIFVAIAFDQLGRGGSVSAALTAAFAAGALVAAAAISRRRRWRLTTLTTLGALLLSIPLVVLGELDRLGPVMALIAVLGAGNALVEIGGHTMLQRACSEAATSRAFGVLDSTLLLSTSIGATAAGVILSNTDLATFLVWLGAGSAATLAGLSAALRHAERQAIAPADAEMVEALRTVTFLAPLPLPTLERLVRGLERRDVPAGCRLITEGDDGDEFFVLLSGAADVATVQGLSRRLNAPSSFGEVALLHESPRTATVTTTEPSCLAVIRRTEFLDAIKRSAASHRGALTLAQSYRVTRDE